ncbi:MAG: fatty acid desaturase [Rhodocyclales bacterium]|nr:fatty acid desaturase [Rhodocyclales bacterium]
MFAGYFDLPWWGVILVVLALTHVTIAAVTIFLHRHQAHRALELGPLPSHFFRCWLWLTTGMVTKEWVAIHRKHHAKVDTAEDPHSPQIHGLPRVLFGGVFLYEQEAHRPATIARYGHGTPDDWLERRLYAPLHKFGIFLMLAVDLALFGAGTGALVWGVQMIWIPFWAAGVINGVGHFWGYRNFACQDASTNIVPWGILIGGEELHNNHHAYAASARLSNRWYEFDIGWLYIRILAALHLARVTKLAPALRFVARPAVDRDTLLAVMTHRYDVLAKFLKSLQRLAAEERERLRLDAREGRLLQRLLRQDAASLPRSQREKLDRLLARSEPLTRVYAMRGELEALWARQTASREQLVAQLRDWIARAEASGIRQLEEFSLRLRQYAL